MAGNGDDPRRSVTGDDANAEEPIRPAAAELLRKLQASAPRARGRLRIYLGMAPGVGKTYAMLNEGKRRKSRGTDVVVGFVETYNRPNTIAQLGDLEIVPRKQIEYRGVTLEEMDTEAVIARHPQVALVDELAHTNAPGSKHEKRWQDVYDLLDAGITVIGTVNVQHLESLADIVETITGVTVRERIPDKVIDDADEVEIVDMSPQALRQRIKHGNVYPAGAGRAGAARVLPRGQPDGAARAGAASRSAGGRRKAHRVHARAPHRQDLAGRRARDGLRRPPPAIGEPDPSCLAHV